MNFGFTTPSTFQVMTGLASARRSCGTPYGGYALANCKWGFVSTLFT